MASKATSKTTNPSSGIGTATEETSLNFSAFGDRLHVGGEGDHGKSLSMHTYETEGSMTSFNDIVELDEEGHPFIDINRLIYHPGKHHPHHVPHLQKEKIIWYFPDFSFILLNLLTLCLSMYFVLAGITSLTWIASISMFTLPNCTAIVNEREDNQSTSVKEENFYYIPCLQFLEDPDRKFNYTNTGYDFNAKNHDFTIISTKLTNIQTFGLVLVGLEFINIINVMVGINACLEGYTGVLNHHITIDGMIVLGEFVISSIVSYTGICDGRQVEVVKMLLMHYVRWYNNILKSSEDESDKEKLVNTQIDALQINLGCCGVDSWVDYMSAEWPESDWTQMHNDLDDTELVIPHSCCKEWWIRNVYCSHGVHNWAHPLAPPEKIHQFKERIVEEGCIYKLEQTCERMRLFMGRWSFFSTIVHLVFIVFEAVAAQILIKNINNLIAENKKMMKKKEMTHDENGSDLDLSTISESQKAAVGSGSKAESGWTKIPPPTEDEIVTIKQRANFNRFIANVKGGIVGKWMREGHAIVTDGTSVDDAKNRTALQDLPEEERKLKEKELIIHGRSSKRDVLHINEEMDDDHIKQLEMELKRKQMKQELVKNKAKKKDILGESQDKIRPKREKQSKKKKKKKGQGKKKGVKKEEKQEEAKDEPAEIE